MKDQVYPRGSGSLWERPASDLKTQLITFFYSQIKASIGFYWSIYSEERFGADRSERCLRSFWLCESVLQGIMCVYTCGYVAVYVSLTLFALHTEHSTASPLAIQQRGRDGRGRDGRRERHI